MCIKVLKNTLDVFSALGNFFFLAIILGVWDNSGHYLINRRSERMYNVGYDGFQMCVVRVISNFNKMSFSSADKPHQSHNIISFGNVLCNYHYPVINYCNKVNWLRISKPWFWPSSSLLSSLKISWHTAG